MITQDSRSWTGGLQCHSAMRAGREVGSVEVSLESGL